VVQHGPVSIKACAGRQNTQAELLKSSLFLTLYSVVQLKEQSQIILKKKKFKITKILELFKMPHI